MKKISKKQGLIDELIVRLKDETKEVEVIEIIGVLQEYQKDLELLRLSYVQKKIRDLSKLEKDLMKVMDLEPDLEDEL